MVLRWRLLLPGLSTARDLVVDAAPGTTVADLRTALTPHATTDGLVLHASANPVDDTAVLGKPPLLDGATLTLAEHRTEAPTTPLLQLHVRSGPDTGFVFDLPRGEHSLGRSPEATVRLDDSDVSRVHALLDVRTREVTVRDAGSTNGTYLDGMPVGLHAVPLRPGRLLRIGRTTLALVVAQSLPAAVRPDGAGHLLVNRSPRLPTGTTPEVIELPEEPTDPAPARLSWLAALLPLVLSGAIALVLRSPTMLFFGLMSPVMLLGQWVDDRRGARKSGREARSRYADRLAAAREQLAAALAAETDARHDADPEPATVLAICRRPLSRLWERDARADGVRARIGLADVVAYTECPRGPHARVGPVPLDVELSAPGGLAVAGPRPAALAATRALLGRIATWYSPRDLHLVVVSPAERSRDWAWSASLPHTSAMSGDAPDLVLDELARTVIDRAGSPSREPWTGPRTLVVIDGAARLRSVPGLTTLLADGARSGLHCLSLDDTLSRLPTEAASVLDLTTDPATFSSTTGGRHTGTDVAVDAVALGWAERLAEALAPLRDSAPGDSESSIPQTVSLLDLLGLPEVTAEALGRRWAAAPRSTAFPIGADASGPLVLDLCRDGPHALVGGTTGSGKSELLVALVASLAAVNRPDELTFVLVDYKGGAAFAGCAHLPHVTGVVTDLDASLTERAMASLDAELKRRERLLAEHGCQDLTAYQARKGPEDAPLARLLIVVDELRALSEDLPDFVTGLVRVASLGRSLGIHRVVATQRPAGVVTADMRANLGLRIALRVRDVVDSLDVLDAPDAARIHGRTPGRGLVRSAATGLTPVQCALVTGHTGRHEGVRLVSLDGVPVTSPQCSPDTDLARLAAACRQAASTHAIEAPPPPWLAPLPAFVATGSLAGMPGQLALGLLDDPPAQAQRPYYWDVGAGPLGLTGPPRSGRSTALQTVATQIAVATCPSDVHVYAVHTGGLAELASLAHVGAVVDLADLSRLDRLVRLLERLPGPRSALRMLLLDDWDAVAQALLDARQQPLLDRLIALVTRGHERDLRTVVAGPRSGASGPLAGVFSQRVLLLPADPIDLAMAGLASRAVPARAQPGRGLDVASGREVQLAVPATAPDDASGQCAGTAYLRELGERSRSRYADLTADSLPIRVPELPEQVEIAGLPSVPGVVLVGVGAEGPLGVRLQPGQRRVAVLGRGASGRTTTLRAMAAGLQRLGRPVVTVSPEGRSLLAGVPAIGPTDVDALVVLRRDQPSVAVLVDDADRLAGMPIEPVLTEIARLVDQDEGFVAVAATTRHAADRPASLVGQMAAAGCGVLLGRSDPRGEEVLGTRGLVPHRDCPGRGHLVRDGVAEVVQVAR